MKQISANSLSLVCGLLAIFLFTGVHAWTDKIELLKDVNTLCKLEPESQCTSAIRIGLQAPGVDMHQSSMASMRLDNANLQGANLSMPSCSWPA